MKLGLHIYDFTWPGGASQLGPTLVKIAQTAEAWGFDRIGTMDVGLGRDDGGADVLLGGRTPRWGPPPTPPQRRARPPPPILIAGSGEQRTLRLVARYADACNLQPGPQIPKKLEILRQHCEAEGRDYDTIEKTCMFAFDVGEDGSKVGELIGQLRWLASLGIETVLGVVPQVYRVKPLEVIGREVIPAVADL